MHIAAILSPETSLEHLQKLRYQLAEIAETFKKGRGRLQLTWTCDAKNIFWLLLTVVLIYIESEILCTFIFPLEPLMLLTILYFYALSLGTETQNRPIGVTNNLCSDFSLDGKIMFHYNGNNVAR